MKQVICLQCLMRLIHLLNVKEAQTLDKVQLSFEFIRSNHKKIKTQMRRFTNLEMRFA
jgi:hypothetical protein